MNEILSTVGAVLHVFIQLSAFALICQILRMLYSIHRKGAPLLLLREVPGYTVSNAITTGNLGFSVTMIAPEPPTLANANPAPTVQPVAEEPVKPATKEKTPVLEEGEEIIECGNCKKDIKSPPKATRLGDKGSQIIYTCEHCGTVVSLEA